MTTNNIEHVCSDKCFQFSIKVFKFLNVQEIKDMILLHSIESFMKIYNIYEREFDGVEPTDMILNIDNPFYVNGKCEKIIEYFDIIDVSNRLMRSQRSNPRMSPKRSPRMSPRMSPRRSQRSSPRRSPVRSPNNEPDNGPNNESNNELNSEPNNESINEPINEPNNESNNEPIEPIEPINEPNNEPNNESIEPNNESIEPNNEPINEFINESINESLNEPFNEPNEPINEPNNELNNEPNNEPINGPINEPNNEPNYDPFNEVINQLNEFKKIPLTKYHVCDESCKTVRITLPKKKSSYPSTFFDQLQNLSDNEIRLLIKLNNIFDTPHIICRYIMTAIPNPDFINEKCLSNGKPQETSFRVETFKKDYQDGKILLDSEKIVIPHKKITILFTYPLSNIFKFEFESESNSGFTLPELIYYICDTYEKIYATEEETATVNTYTYTIECTNCAGYDDKNLEIITDLDETEECCAICRENIDNLSQNAKLPCNHVFHYVCIKTWLTINKNNTCPLCVSKVVKKNFCEICKDGKIDITYQGIMRSREHLDAMDIFSWNRERTNGIYGIYGHTIGNLHVESLSYHPANGLVTMFIGS